MSDHNVTAILSVKDRNYSSQMEAAIGQLEDLEQATGSSSTSVAKMGAAFGAAAKVVESAMSAVSSCVGDAIKRFDTLRQFPKVMQQIGFSADDAGAATEKLTDGIQGLPTSLSEITANTQSLALLTSDLEEAADLSIALNDAFLASGASSEDAARGLQQYTQMLSTGTVDLESWRTLLETMGVALNDVAAEFGYTGQSAKNDLYNALKGGEITFDEFNQTLMNLDQGLSTANDSFVSFADRALTASEGIGTSLQNIRTAVVTGLANMVSSIDEAMQEADLGTLASGLNSLKGVVTDVFNTIGNVIKGAISIAAPVLKNLAENMDLVAVSVGALAARFIALKVIDTARNKIKDFRTAMKNSSDTIKKYNSLLEKYGSKQKAAAAAEEAMAKAKELSEKATQAQIEAEKAAMDVRQLAVDALKVENDALKAGATAEQAKAAASKANASATEAQIAAEQKKIDAEKLDAQATQAAAVAEQTQAEAQTLGNTQISLKSALLGVLSGQTSIATAAQQAFNAALSANPIGFVITAISGLIAAFSGLAALLGGAKTEAQKYAEEQEEVRKSLEESAEELEESTKEHEKNITVSKENAESATKLADEIAKLQGDIEEANAAEEDSSQLKTELQSKVSELNSLLGESVYAYDETTNALSASTDEMKAYIKQAQKQEEVNELTALQADQLEKLSNARAEATEAEKDYEAAKNASIQAEEDYNQAVQEGGANYDRLIIERDQAIADAESRMKSAQKTMEDANARVSDYETQWQETSEKVAAAQEELKTSQEEYSTVLKNTANDYSLLETAAVQAVAAQYQANQEMIANGSIAYEQLSEKNQALVDNLQSMWDQYYESSSNLWEVLKDEETLSVDQMIQNLQTNQKTIETMASNMGTLRDRFASLGLDTAVLDQLDNMGIEASADIAELVTASDEQLQALATAFGNAGTTSTEAMSTSLGTAAASNIPAAIQNLVDTTKQGLADQIAAADWAELGEAQIQGIVEGVEGMTDDAVDASVKAAEEGYKGYQDSIQSGSPSKVYAGYGEDQMTGLIQGINNKRGQVLSLLQAVAAQIQAPFKNLQSAFQNYGSYAMQGFINGMNSRRSSVMSTANSIANTAASTISNALQIGSPSKLLRKYGAWGIEGLEIGMESREKGVKRIARRITDAMTSIFIPQMSDYSYSGELAMAGGFTYSMDGLREDMAELIDAVNSRPIVVQNDLKVDGRSFAKSTTMYITREQESQAQLAEYIEGKR